MADINLKNLQNLKHLRHHCFTDLIKIGSLNVEQIYQMETVELSHTKVKFEDILKFKGSRLHITSDDFDTENIKKYLQMWKNGEIHRNVKHVTIRSVKFEGIEKQGISEELDVYNYKDDGKKCRFQFHWTNDTNKEWVTSVKFNKYQLNIRLQKK